ncbi:MAG TPA: hypothetical protein VHL59_17255, partial [Thermoanaerobaculia bacterium]|nr:hypothetical protein [Thermoanaerobaculia bacterium]
PTAAFLKVAMNVGIEARIKYAQLRLADVLERRLHRLEALNVRGERIAFDCHDIPFIFESTWTLHPRSDHAHLNHSGPRQERPANERRVPYSDDAKLTEAWMPEMLHRSLPRYSEASVALRELHHDAGSDDTWRWQRRHDNLTLRKTVSLGDDVTRRFYVTPPPSQSIIIRSAVPSVIQRFPPNPRPDFKEALNCTVPSSPDVAHNPAKALDGITEERPRWMVVRHWRRLVYILVAVVCFYVLLSAVGFLGERMFLYGIKEARWLPDGKKLASGLPVNLFVERCDAAVSELADEQTFQVLSIAKAVQREEPWRNLLEQADTTRKDLLIDDFEVGAKGDFPSSMLSFFETLVTSRRHRIAVFSKIGWAAVVAMQKGAARERWQALFDAFVRIDESLLKGERTRSHARSWHNCSTDEKLVLYHLARYGLVNEKTRAILENLLARKLVSAKPDLQFTDPDFEKFVIEAAKAEGLGEANVAAPVPRRFGAKVAIAVLVAAAVLLVLLMTQKDLLNATMVIVTGLAAILPALLKLVAMLSGKSSSNQPEG